MMSKYFNAVFILVFLIGCGSAFAADAVEQMGLKLLSQDPLLGKEVRSQLQQIETVATTHDERVVLRQAKLHRLLATQRRFIERELNIDNIVVPLPRPLAKNVVDVLRQKVFARVNDMQELVRASFVCQEKSGANVCTENAQKLIETATYARSLRHQIK